MSNETAIFLLPPHACACTHAAREQLNDRKGFLFRGKAPRPCHEAKPRSCLEVMPRFSRSDASDQRQVHFNTPRVAEHRFANNRIRTSLYTLLNFIPKGIIFEEFSRLANSYFALVVVLQLVPDISTTGGIPYTLPLLTITTRYNSTQGRRSLCPAAGGTPCSIWMTRCGGGVVVRLGLGLTLSLNLAQSG